MTKITLTVLKLESIFRDVESAANISYAKLGWQTYRVVDDISITPGVGAVINTERAVDVQDLNN